MRELGAFTAGTATVVAARPGLRTLLRGGQSECFPHIGPEYTDDQIFRCGRNASNTMRARDLVLVSHFRCLPCSSGHERAKPVWTGAHRYGRAAVPRHGQREPALPAQGPLHRPGSLPRPLRRRPFRLRGRRAADQHFRAPRRRLGCLVRRGLPGLCAPAQHGDRYGRRRREGRRGWRR